MAELKVTITDPVKLSKMIAEYNKLSTGKTPDDKIINQIINKVDDDNKVVDDEKVDDDKNNKDRSTPPLLTNISDEDISFDVSSDDDDDNSIDGVYDSMSKIIETLNANNLILNIQVKKMRDGLDLLQKELMNIKNDGYNTFQLHANKITDLLSRIELVPNNKEITIEINKIHTSINEMIKEINILKHSNIQKQLISTRSYLLQTINKNTNKIKQDVDAIKQDIQNIKKNNKKIIINEIRQHMDSESMEDKFEEFAREYKGKLSQFIRRSSIQRSASMQPETSALLKRISQLDRSAEIAQLKKQQHKMQEQINILLNERNNESKLSGE